MTDTIKNRAELDPEDFSNFAEIAGFEHSWAVVIGINDYGGEHATLANAVNDAREVARVLKEDFGFDHVFTLYDPEASREAILSWLRDKLPGNISPDELDSDARVGKNDRIIFFFAGHGTTQRNEAGQMRGFIIPQDARRGRYADYIDMSELHDACGWIPAKHILIVLDCCFSGAAAIGAMANPTPSPNTMTDAYLKRITKRKTWQIMTAGDKDELAADSGTRPGHSAFTSALLAGLEGLADHNNDKLITATDLANYVKPEVTRQTARGGREGQSPFFNYLAGSGQGDFVFVREGDKPIIQPANVIEAEVKPLMKQYPWLWGVLAIVVLVILVGIGILISQYSAARTAQQEHDATVAALQIALGDAEATAKAAPNAQQTAEAGATATAQAGASEEQQQAAQVEVEEAQKESTAAVSDLNEKLAAAGSPTSTPIPTDTPTLEPPTDTPIPSTNTPTGTPTLRPSPTATLTNIPASLTPPAMLTTQVVTFTVKTESDDAEEIIHNGEMYTSSSDLELFVDQDIRRDAQLIGIRFSDVTIPKGANIINAYIEFEAKNVESWEKPRLAERVILTVRGETFDNERSFAQSFNKDETNNIRNRTRTSAFYEWVPESWVEGNRYQTGNLNKIVQEIIDQPQWPSEPSPDQALVFIIDGRHDTSERGVRIAKSRENGEQVAPMLYMEYQLP